MEDLKKYDPCASWHESGFMEEEIYGEYYSVEEVDKRIAGLELQVKDLKNKLGQSKSELSYMKFMG